MATVTRSGSTRWCGQQKQLTNAYCVCLPLVGYSYYGAYLT